MINARAFPQHCDVTHYCAERYFAQTISRGNGIGRRKNSSCGGRIRHRSFSRLRIPNPLLSFREPLLSTIIIRMTNFKRTQTSQTRARDIHNTHRFNTNACDGLILFRFISRVLVKISCFRRCVYTANLSTDKKKTRKTYFK